MGVWDKPFTDPQTHDERLGITAGCPCECHRSRTAEGRPGACNYNGGCAGHHSEPERKEYRVPPTFLDDHIDRDLLAPERVVRRTRDYTVVSLSRDEVTELITDAWHYADPVNGYRADYPGLVASAAATAKRLAAAMDAEAAATARIAYGGQ